MSKGNQKSFFLRAAVLVVTAKFVGQKIAQKRNKESSTKSKVKNNVPPEGAYVTENSLEAIRLENQFKNKKAV